MNYLEVLAMVAALLAMAGALVAKFCTEHLIKKMQHQVDTVQQTRQSALGKLKKAELQHCVFKRNREHLLKKKEQVGRRKNKLGREIKEMRETASRRARIGVAA